MSEITGASVKIQTSYDAAALRQAIKDFQDGKISADQLKQSTDTLKTSLGGQNQALRALNQSFRVNNFQLLEGMAVLRNATTMFRDLNSVYQTLTLKSIDNNTQTVAQQQAYDNLKTSVNDVVNELSVLGSSNTDVSTGFSDIISKANSLNSTDIQGLIDQIENLKKSTKLSPDDITALNTFETQLQNLKQETIQKEDTKNMQDFVQTISTLGLTAGSIGTFALNLAKIPAAVTVLNTALAASPYVLAFLAAVELLRGGQDINQTLGFQTAGGGENVDTSNIKAFNNATQNNGPAGGIQDFFKRLGAPGDVNGTVPVVQGDVNIHFDGPISFSSDMDINTWIDKVAKALNIKAGTVVK